MGRLGVAWLLALGLVAGCSNSDKGGTMPPAPTPTTGSLKGVATLGGMKSGNAGIVVGVQGGAAAVTDDAGNYVLNDLAPGSVTVEAQYPGYKAASTTVTITAGQVAMAFELDLQPLVVTPQGGVTGHVFLFDTTNAVGSMVTLSSNAGVATSAADGSYSFSNVPAGVYDATFDHNGYVSQTVHNIIVGASGSYTIPDVTLRRDVTTINGHSIQPVATSPDWSQRLIRIDGVLQVVSEASGAGVVVGNGTTAINGAISADHEHVAVWNNGSQLWLGAIDGSAPALLTTRWSGTAFFSPDGSHLFFNLNNPTSGQTDYYVVASSGGTPTLVAASATVWRTTPDHQGVLLINNAQTAQGLAVNDAITVDTNAGTAHTTAAVYSGNMFWFANQTTSFATFATATGTTTFNGNPVVTGDLYYWNGSSSTPTQLSGGASALPSVNTQLQPPFYIQPLWADYAYFAVRNLDVDDSNAIWALNVHTGAIAPMLHHTMSTVPFGTFYGQSLPIPSTTFNIDMNDNAGTYSFDLYSLDLAKGTATLIQANAARIIGGTPAKNDNSNLYVFPAVDVLNGFDQIHWVYGNSQDLGTNTNNLVLWDGTQSHKLTTTPVDQVVVFLMRCNRDYRTCAFSSPSTTGTPLTIVNLPAAGTAGDGVAVPLGATPPQPGNLWQLSLDGSTVVYRLIDTSVTPNAGVLYKVPTAASASTVTPTRLFTDPNSGQFFSWVGVSAKGDVAFAGDNLGGSANAWAVGASGTAVALDAAGLGTSTPRLFALADGARTLVTNESGGANFIVQVDTAATPTITKLTGYDTGKVWINLAQTRFFYSSTTPTLEWVTSTANGSTPGTWTPISVGGPPPWMVDQMAMYFHDDFANGFAGHLTGYDGATGSAAVATTNAIAARWSPTGSQLLVLDQDGSGVTHFVVSPKGTPARNVLGDGFPSTDLNPKSPGVAGLFFDPSFSPFAQPTMVYSAFDANAGTGNPPSWSVHELVLATNTIGTLATNVDPNGIHFDFPGTHLLLQTVPDPLLGTFTLYTNAPGATTAVKVSDNVHQLFQHSTGNLAGATLTPQQGALFTALPGMAAQAMTAAAVSTSVQPFWSGDGSHLVVVDHGTSGFGPAYGAAVGAAGAELDTYSVGALPDMTGTNELLVAQHPTDPGLVIDHATLQ